MAEKMIEMPAKAVKDLIALSQRMTTVFLEAARSTGSSFDSIGRSASDLGGQITSLDGSMTGFSRSIDSALGGIKGLGNAVGLVVPGFAGLTDVMVDTISGIKGLAENVGGAINSLQESALQFDRVSIGIRQSFGKAFVESADETRKSLSDFRNSVIEARRTTYQPFGEIIQGAEQLGKVFTETELVDEAQFRELGRNLNISGDRLDALTSTFFVAKAAGLDYGEAIGLVRKASENIIDPNAPDKVRQSQQVLAAFSAVTRNTGVNIEFVKGALGGVIDTVALYRDENTQATETVDHLAESVISFTNALKDVGVAGPRAVRFAQDFTNALSKVNIAQRAFIARSAGMGQGMGALSAALQYEQAIAQGRFDEIQEALGAAVRQHGGGRIMRFEEAIQGGESSARQFEIQRGIVQQMTGLQGTEARRVLDILAGARGGGVDSGKELQSLLQTGNDRTQYETTIMEKGFAQMDSHLREIAVNTAALAVPEAAAAMQEYITAETPEDRKEAGENLKRAMEGVEQRIEAQGGITGAASRLFQDLEITGRRGFVREKIADKEFATDEGTPPAEMRKTTVQLPGGRQGLRQALLYPPELEQANETLQKQENLARGLQSGANVPGENAYMLREAYAQKPPQLATRMQRLGAGLNEDERREMVDAALERSTTMVSAKLEEARQKAEANKPAAEDVDAQMKKTVDNAVAAQSATGKSIDYTINLKLSAEGNEIFIEPTGESKAAEGVQINVLKGTDQEARASLGHIKQSK